MKNQHILALGATVVVLALYLSLSSNRDVAVNQLGDTMVTLAEVSAEQAGKLTITVADKAALTLEKKENAWVLPSGHPANAQKVDGLLEDLKSLQAEKRRVNMDQLAPYGLGEGDPRTVLTIADGAGTSLASVSLGKKGPDWGSAWTQREGKAEVLLVQEGAVGRLVDGELKVKDWLNRQPAQFDTKSAATLTLSGEVQGVYNRPAGLVDAGPQTWTTSTNQDADDDKVSALLNQLSGLYIDDLATDVQVTPTLEVTVGFAAGATAAKLGQSADKKWFLLVGQLGYSLSESAAKGLRNKARDLVGVEKLD